MKNKVKLLANRAANLFKCQQYKKKKKKSIANNTKRANIFNQITISDGDEAKQRFNQICKGKSIVEQSNNNNTEQMDVNQAIGIQFDEDIIMEILSRLPVRYLVQFKCVSKFWKALISDPYFKKKHLNHAKNDRDSQKLLINQRCFKSGKSSMYCCPLVQRVKKVQKLDCPSISKSKVYCSCNGLVIIHVIDTISDRRSILMLWNPSTRESIVLPDPEFPLQDDFGFGLGLGYDSTSGDYKILKIRNDIDGIKEPGEILALKSGSWRNIGKHPRGICNLLAGMDFTLAFVNGAYHWIGMFGDYTAVPKKYSLVSFSISNEVYGEIPLPEQILCLKGNFCIGVSVLDGMLCVHSTSLHQGKRTFKLWELKDYGVKESWNALLAIDDPCILKAVPKHRFANGEVLFGSIYSQYCRYSFRTSRGRFGLCDGVAYTETGYAIEDGVAYTESMISPKSVI